MFASSATLGVGVVFTLLYASLRETLPWAGAQFESSVNSGPSPVSEPLSDQAPNLDKTLDVLSKVLGHQPTCVCNVIGDGRPACSDSSQYQANFAIGCMFGCVICFGVGIVIGCFCCSGWVHRKDRSSRSQLARIDV